MANKNNLSPKGKSRRNKKVQQAQQSVGPDEDMKDHYDFSVAERGKFYRADAEYHFPVYLEPDVNDFLVKLADQKKVAVDALVNELLRADIDIIQSAGS